MIRTLEAEAAKRGYRQIGLGVGLYADYGPAQRFYNKLAYVVDGFGITSHNQPVAPGATVRVDDDLNIWLTKRLLRCTN